MAGTAVGYCVGTNVEGPAIGAELEADGTEVPTEGAAEELFQPTP